jgi:CDP-glycerol glycerophosphotransferase
LLNNLLALIDKSVKKRNDYWIFPVYFIGEGNFTDNNLAVFNIVKDDPNIKKIILIKQVDIEENGNNVVIVKMNSFKAIWYIMRSNIIFVQHSVWLDLAKAKYQIIDPFSRIIINLWHGIPIKDISHKNTGIINKRSLKEMPNYKIITSSETDKKNMQKAFYKTNEKDFWITGIPRNDFLITPENELPETYKKELAILSDLIGDKKLFLYAPTYRETNVSGSYYDFSEEELDRLEDILVQQNAVLGIRYHIYRKPDCHKRILNRKNTIDLSAEVISDVRLIIRKSDLIITDYSSLYVDALYIEKKCISFAYDYEHYLKTQRGFFYDFEAIFPGKICLNFDELMKTISNYSQVNSKEEIKKIQNIQSKLFKYIDTNNSQRVVDKVKEIAFE